MNKAAHVVLVVLMLLFVRVGLAVASDISLQELEDVVTSEFK